MAPDRVTEKNAQASAVNRYWPSRTVTELIFPLKRHGRSLARGLLNLWSADAMCRRHGRLQAVHEFAPGAETDVSGVS